MVTRDWHDGKYFLDAFIGVPATINTVANISVTAVAASSDIGIKWRDIN